jgi:hypothetical protein
MKSLEDCMTQDLRGPLCLIGNQWQTLGYHSKACRKRKYTGIVCLEDFGPWSAGSLIGERIEVAVWRETRSIKSSIIPFGIFLQFTTINLNERGQGIICGAVLAQFYFGFAIHRNAVHMTFR